MRGDAGGVFLNSYVARGDSGAGGMCGGYRYFGRVCGGVRGVCSQTPTLRRVVGELHSRVVASG